MNSQFPRDLYGITGWPLSQTLSPLIHNTAFQTLGMPAVYMQWPVEPDCIAEFVSAVRTLNIRGCSVTIPHKIRIIPFLDKIGQSAQLAGAVNTIYWHEGALCGENTDVGGFLAPLNKKEISGARILLLGAGGAAHAAAAGLKSWGITDVTVTSPGNVHQFELAEKYDFIPVKWEQRYDYPAELVINSTPMGMKGKFVDENPYDFAKAPETANGMAYDLVYNPAQTLFLKQAATAGRKIISGFDMFYSQAKAQFRIWTGRDFPDCIEKVLNNALYS